jgi:flagellar biosynthesis GTPase FlhF
MNNIRVNINGFEFSFSKDDLINLKSPRLNPFLLRNESITIEDNDMIPSSIYHLIEYSKDPSKYTDPTLLEIVILAKTQLGIQNPSEDEYIIISENDSSPSEISKFKDKNDAIRRFLYIFLAKKHEVYLRQNEEENNEEENNEEENNEEENNEKENNEKENNEKENNEKEITEKKINETIDSLLEEISFNDIISYIESEKELMGKNLSSYKNQNPLRRLSHNTLYYIYFDEIERIYFNLYLIGVPTQIKSILNYNKRNKINKILRS